MYLKPHVADRLIAAIAALLPDIESEIEQRKHSGNAEYWQGLEDRYTAVHGSVVEAKLGHGSLSPIQAQILESYEEDDFHGLAQLSRLELASHDDGLVHFLLSEVNDCDADNPESVAEARARLWRAAEQLQRCAALLAPSPEGSEA